MSSDSEQKRVRRVAKLLAAQPSFEVKAVCERLDQADAADKARVEKRLASRPSLDLGDDA